MGDWLILHSLGKRLNFCMINIIQWCIGNHFYALRVQVALQEVKN